MLPLTARTDAGERLVALAESLAAELAEHAAEHDRSATYPFAGIEALRAARYFAAPIPSEHGGLGVASVHDVLVASSRLARGDASLAIGVNMHLVAVLNVVRRWQIYSHLGDARRAAGFAAWMEQVARDGTVIAAAISEPGQDLTRPGTTATRTADGWRIDGRKIFCTMSPAASELLTAVTFTGDDGVERYGYVQIPVGTPGVRVHDDWDALGMRASGSHSVSLEGVELPAAALRGGFRTGDPVPYMARNLASGLFHAAASLGIAESALGTATSSLARRGLNGSARTPALVSEAEIDLFACRAALARAAGLVDDHLAGHPDSDGPADDIVAVFTETQMAKTLIGEAATRVVDRALTLSGGAGYLNGHPLARAYRDVRAGAFMHPLAATRAHDLVAAVALGQGPDLH